MQQSVLNIVSLVLVFNSLLLTSCKNDDIQQPCNLIDVVTPFNAPCKLTNNIDSIKIYIQGRWTWLQEERAQRGQPTKYLTPRTEGYSLELELKNNVATYYKCGKKDSEYKFDIVRWKDAPGSGTAGFPEGELPVLIYYDLKTGLRVTDVPLKLCDQYCILQYQFVSSIVGPFTWRKISK